MTAVTTTLRSAYLAGPMRGIEEYNFPAFRAATAWLRREGWAIFSPAERDENDPDIDHEENVAGWSGSRGLDYFMAYDLKAVCEMDAVICLPGWEQSQGARLETMVAVEVGHPVFEIEETQPHVFVRRTLKSVEPDYVRFTFLNGSLSSILEIGDVEIETIEEEIRPAVEGSLEHGWAEGPRRPDWLTVQEETATGAEVAPELVEAGEAAMRAFDTGATRNIVTDPQYEGFLSPLAILLFGEYMKEHQVQADGTLRAADNWQNGIPLDSYMDSLWRHVVDLWLHHRGWGSLAREDLRSALAGIMFNVNGYAHETMLETYGLERKERR